MPSDISPDTPMEQPAPPSAPGTGRRRRRIPRPILAALVCMVAGLAGGIGMQLSARPPDSDHRSLSHRRSAVDSSTFHRPLPNEAEEPNELDALDLVIRSGDFARGLKMCVELGRHQPDDRSREYREAICLEGLGRFDQATQKYKHISEATDNRLLWAWAVIGQARCALKLGDSEAARRFVDQVTLQSGHPQMAGRVVLEECLYLRCRLSIHDLKPAHPPDPFDPHELAWPSVVDKLEQSVDRSLSVQPTNGEPVVEKIDDPDQPIQPEELPVTLHLPPKPVTNMLLDIGRAVGLTVQVDPACAPLLAEKSNALDVSGAPLGEVLTALLEPLHLIWQIDSARILVAPEKRMERATRRAVARAQLDRALAAAPEHAFAIAVQVWRVNLEVESGSSRTAAKELKQLLELAPHAAESVCVAYNLGLLELQEGNREAARARFLDVVDRHPQARWGDIGWWWIGRSYMDEGDFAMSERPLRSAIAGSTLEVASAALLALCATEMLSGNDAAARLDFRSHRTGSWARHVKTGQMIEAILHCRVGPSDGRRAIVRSAIRDAQDGAALGPAGKYLAGQAYRDIGEPDRMAELYDAAADAVHGALAIRMTFAVAERQRELGLHIAARSRYLAVLAADPHGLLGRQSQLRIAELAARNGDGADCIARCRKLVGKDGIDEPQLLAIMGRGFELVKDHRRAAEAFAGRVPAE